MGSLAGGSQHSEILWYLSMHFASTLAVLPDLIVHKLSNDYAGRLCIMRAPAVERVQHQAVRCSRLHAMHAGHLQQSSRRAHPKQASQEIAALHLISKRLLTKQDGTKWMTYPTCSVLILRSVYQFPSMSSKCFTAAAPIGLIFTCRCRLAGLDPVKLQTSDFAHWQREQQKSGAWDPHLAFWRDQLSGAPDALDLPTDTSRPKTRSGEGHWLPMHLDVAGTKQLRDLASKYGTSVLVVVAAAFQVRPAPPSLHVA